MSCTARFNTSHLVNTLSDKLSSITEPVKKQGIIYLSFSSQYETSVMGVRLEGPREKTIIMHIHENNVYSLATMDQDADSVWVMTLDCLGHNNVYCQ